MEQREALTQLLDDIAASANHSDQFGVPRSNLEKLAALGALGVYPSKEFEWEINERLAGADASTWFCWVQHHTPLATMATGGNCVNSDAIGHRWLASLENGSAIAAVAFAHIRRPGTPNPVANHTAAGWELTGKLDWVTSWDIADLVMVLAATADNSRVLVFFIPIADFEQLIPGSVVHEPLKLVAMSGTHTRPITFHASLIPNEYLFAIYPRADWLAGDSIKTAKPNPAACGIAAAAIDHLAEIGVKRKSEAATNLAGELREKCAILRKQAIEMNSDPRGFSPEELLSVRVQTLELAREASTAVVIALAGASMQSGSTAERRMREAMFLQVQAQTSQSREALLTSMQTRDLR